MKIQELRIGNTVLYSGIIVRVEAMSKKIVSCSGVEKNRYTPIKIEDLKPIKLTFDLLIENGFERHNLGALSLKISKYKDIEFTSDIKKSWIYGEEVSIKSLHHLENIFFDITQRALKTKVCYTLN